ncbi:hypothetical protein BWQ96_04675 [Gracilariopsis chorda]|uniref:Uncharacterized protein n=1 Tax=Gracilariopsis chorda TaxID=448386 RepID=A0A2V3IV09_9FLOR|nr:hypothetical protein BWQ96_04675 [Gracilariopsis chorda]|eukprot:PXF45537.1 hypothetical protein BWQ96_04675 [Gracilariopsis chorda]
MFCDALRYYNSGPLASRKRVEQLLTKVIDRNEDQDEPDMISLASLLPKTSHGTDKQLLDRVIRKSGNTKAFLGSPNFSSTISTKHGMQLWLQSPGTNEQLKKQMIRKEWRNWVLLLRIYDSHPTRRSFTT